MIKEKILDFKTSDGTKLEVIRYLSNSNKKEIVFATGLGGKAQKIPLINFLVEKGYNITSFSPRNSGKSEGHLTVDNYLSDLEEVIKYVTKETKKVPYLIGTSMGGYAAARILGEKPVAKKAYLLAPLIDLKEQSFTNFVLYIMRVWVYLIKEGKFFNQRFDKIDSGLLLKSIHKAKKCNKKLKFPKGFLWGSAMSSHQVEGNNTNDWSEWEKENAEKLAEEAKEKYMPWQQKKFPEMFNPPNYISGKACNHYNLYEKDFDIAKKLNTNALRISLEWSRIEPQEGKFNEKEIEHYRKVIKALKKRGLEPFITLWHWTNPLWIRDIGGFENKKTVECFIRYAEKICNSLGKEMTFWMPFNEPQTHVTLGYLTGMFPPNKKSFIKAIKVIKNINEAHRRTYELFHSKFGNQVKIGSANALVSFIPKNKNFIDSILVKIVNYIQIDYYLNPIKNYQDFIGLQYYMRNYVSAFNTEDAANFRNPEADNISDLGWEIYPKGIYDLIKKLSKYKRPIYVTENGIADVGDKKREEFIKSHLFWINQAIKERGEVRGYFYWSLLDNFEWVSGFWPRFGLVEINYKTKKRKVRPSAKIYAKICSNNGFYYNFEK